MKEIIKRFCFVLGKQISKDNSLKLFMTTINEVSIWNLNNFEVFETDNTFFCIVDITSISDAITIKNDVEKLIKQSDVLNFQTVIISERIFKKVPMEEYTVEKINYFKRIVLTLELQNDSELLKTYKEAHKPENMWPQILVNMDTIGVKNMELYLKGYHAFLIMDTTLDFDMEKDGEKWAHLPKEKEWQEYVAKFQKVDPKSKVAEKWKAMKLINI